MKDQRLAFFRGALDGLLESLEASVRISRWRGPEAIPEPLQKAHNQLLDRLGAANRLAAGKFAGTPVVIAAMTAMSVAIQKLDVAFVEYRRTIAGNPTQQEEGAIALEAEIEAVKLEAPKWSL